LDTVQTAAEVHLIEIQLEDLVLVVHLLDVGGKNDLFHLSAIGLVTTEKTLSRELLGDRASAFSATASFEVANGGRGDADRINAAVLVESLILDRYDGFDQIRRDALNGNFETLFFENRERRLIRRVVNRR